MTLAFSILFERIYTMDTRDRLEKAREARGFTKKGGRRRVFLRAKDGGYVDVELTRSQAIRAFCTECSGWGEMHPRDCPDIHCSLYPFRGKIQLAYHSGTEDDSSKS